MIRRSPINKEMSASDSDLLKGNRPNTRTHELLETSFSQSNITMRDNKRKRIFDDENTENRGSHNVEDLTSFRAEILEMLKIMDSKQSARLDALEKHITEVKGHTTIICEKNMDIERAIEDVSAKIENMQTQVSCLEKDCQQLSSQLQKVEDKYENLDRISKKTCIEIRKIPKQIGETRVDLFKKIRSLITCLRVEIDKSELRDVFRLPSKSEMATSTVIVEFSSTLVKDSVLNAAKSHNKSNPSNQLNARQLGIEGNNSPIYISEQLTSKGKWLFHLARDFAKTEDYMFCWTSNGLVFLRKRHGDPYIIVRSDSQLHSLKKK